VAESKIEITSASKKLETGIPIFVNIYDSTFSENFIVLESANTQSNLKFPLTPNNKGAQAQLMLHVPGTYTITYKNHRSTIEVFQHEQIAFLPEILTLVIVVIVSLIGMILWTKRKKQHL
jgi:hypothetical protein